MDTESQVSGSETPNEGATTPQFVQPSSAKPTSDVDAIVAKAIEKLLPEVDKRIQSQKDRRFSDIEKRLEGLSQLGQLEEMGVTIPEAVKTEMRLRALEGGTSKKDESVNPSIADTLAEAKEILGVASIGTDDPEIVALWKSKQYPDTVRGHAELLRDVTKIAVARAKSPSPTSAQAAAQPGRVMPSPTQEGLLNEYTKDMLANRGNRTAILAVKEKYRKMGLDVDRVAFK